MARRPASAPSTQQRDRLERLDADFLAMLAHEIREPMTSCIGFAELLLQKGERMSPQERVEALETIAKTGRRLIALLEDILEVASLEEGSFTYVMHDVDLNDVVRDVLEEQRARLEGTTVQFDADQDAHVHADRHRIHQVVANLLSNASKFSPEGGTIRIATRGDEGAAEVVLAVQDEGIGIDAADIPKLFQQFSRVAQPGSGDRIPGTGLGLYIAKTIVDAHRGRIWVESEPGRGSTFFVALPRATSGSPR